MIIVSLFGGLGNQMFQYACGTAVVTRLGVKLKLDISLVSDKTARKDFTFREYELGVFNVKEEIATIEEVRQYIPDLWNSKKYIKLLYRFKRVVTRRTLYVEKLKFIYNQDIESVKDNTYLYGYFQTQGYFENLRPELLQSFSLTNEIDSQNSVLIAQIRKENSVSIHVRRGDYENSVFEALSVESYYRKAIELIKTEVESPVFYIFTNDYEWVEENFRTLEINQNIITINTGTGSYMDMVLMSHCKHNICANSSFSWWGAWLNNNPSKKIIAPKKWFKNTDFVESTRDLIPSDWLTI